MIKKYNQILSFQHKEWIFLQKVLILHSSEFIVIWWISFIWRLLKYKMKQHLIRIICIAVHVHIFQKILSLLVLCPSYTRLNLNLKLQKSTRNLDAVKWGLNMTRFWEIEVLLYPGSTLPCCWLWVPSYSYTKIQNLIFT